MALPQSDFKGETPETANNRVEGLADRPLNYYPDQVADIEPQIRKLDLEWLSEATRKNAGIVAAAVLAGGALGFLLKRKYLLASNCALALLLQQVFFRQRRPRRRDLDREMTDIEIERYALKAQRGDYGKLEVIPFK